MTNKNTSKKTTPAKGVAPKKKPVPMSLANKKKLQKISDNAAMENHIQEKAKPSKKTKEEPKTFKGHIMAESTARHYGFIPYQHITVQKQDLQKAKILRDKKSFDETEFSLDTFLEEKIALVGSYLNKEMVDLPQPPTICFSGPLPGSTLAEKKSKSRFFNIHMLGNAKSIADAMVIETTYVIAKEHTDGESDLLIEINSIGDKDSFARFSKEVIHFFKKKLSELDASCRQTFKKDPISLFSCDNPGCKLLHEEAPKPMDFLSEESRSHFKEVLEYLESLNLPYAINHSLIGSKHCSTGTVFRIVQTQTKGKGEKKEIVAIGERYNSIARKAWGKKEVPAMGAHMLIDETKIKESRSIFTRQEDIKFYFIQLGYDAKLRSLTIIEMLRTAKIPVHQALSKDKISNQLASAEKLNVPYLLILGQKEVIENSVTVRHMATRVQETIHIDNLIEYIKKLL